MRQAWLAGTAVSVGVGAPPELRVPTRVHLDGLPIIGRQPGQQAGWHKSRLAAFRWESSPLPPLTWGDGELPLSFRVAAYAPCREPAGAP